MKLWLVRHAPVAGAQGLCYGASDLPADTAATQAAARALAGQLPQGLAVHSSPLGRCRQLAEALQALRPDLAVKPDGRLREMDFGAWEGQPWAAIARAAFDRWLDDFQDGRPGGHGESVRDLMARVASAWDEWQTGSTDQAWLTHAGVMRAALLLARGVRLPATARQWPDEVLVFGGLRVLQGP